MKFIDIHTHIQQHDPAELEGIISRAQEAGVGAMVLAGVTVEDSRRCLELAALHAPLFAGVGVHPTDLDGNLSAPDIAELDGMAARPETVVISETGIDHQQHVLERPVPAGASWREIQERAFMAQIEIALAHRLPIVFHVREPNDDYTAGSAWPAAISILHDTGAGQAGGAAHYFQGGYELAKRVLDAGFMVSLARPLLRLKHLQEAAARLPLDSIVLETDSFPQPFKKDRIKWTEPRHVAMVAETLAQLRGITAAEVRAATSANAIRLLGERGQRVREALEIPGAESAGR